MMESGDGQPRTGVLLPAFWWTLAAVHVAPLVRLSLAGEAAPASRPLLLLVLGLVIAFCGLAGLASLRPAPVRRQAASLVAFLLAASIAHHEAVGAAAPAVLVAPAAVAVVGIVGAAARGSRHRLRQLLETLRTLAIRVIDRPVAVGIVAECGVVPSHLRRRAGPPVRGPPPLTA
jgi:hypothetical protein